MRYFLTITTDTALEDGPIVVSPMGGVVVYHELDDATNAAKALVDGGSVKGCFVQKLLPVALYTPLSSAQFDNPEKVEGN